MLVAGIHVAYTREESAIDLREEVYRLSGVTFIVYLFQMLRHAYFGFYYNFKHPELSECTNVNSSIHILTLA